MGSKTGVFTVDPLTVHGLVNEHTACGFAFDADGSAPVGRWVDDVRPRKVNCNLCMAAIDTLRAFRVDRAGIRVFDEALLESVDGACGCVEVMKSKPNTSLP